MRKKEQEKKEKTEKSTHQDYDTTGWCSSYGIITAQRLLELYKIKLDADDLLEAIKTYNSFYHGLLKIPLRNVFNGIILQQAKDYQLYAQKLFIDYLLSGEVNKSEDSPGAPMREDLEVMRQNLLLMNDNFQVLELDQERLIARCQSTLIQDANQWLQGLTKITKPIQKKLRSVGVKKPDALVQKALVSLLSHYDFKQGKFDKKKPDEKLKKILGIPITPEIIDSFISEVTPLSEVVLKTEQSLKQHESEIKQMTLYLRQFRTDFYKFIVKSKELFMTLPEYVINDAQDTDNREALQFDSTLGENEESKS